jgi:peroxiredoxin
MGMGDQAPAFKLAAKPRHEVDIAAHIGRDKIILLFFPLAFSRVCTAEMCRMRDDWPQLSVLGAKVFGISVDSPFVTERFRQDHNIPFPILSDFNKEVSQQYGVLHEDLFGLKGVSKRAVFVIGCDGRVKYAWVADDPSVQVEFDGIKAALRDA